MPGDTVIASDGAGIDYTVRLETVGAAATGTILASVRRLTESPLDVTLLQGVPKGDKMETIVRATTELGVARIWPVLTERTIVRLEPSRWRERARRWQRVAKEATKQCGRAVIPDVAIPRPLTEVLATLPEPIPGERRVCLWEGEAPPLRSILDDLPTRGAPSSAPWLLLVGPEGGLGQGEVDAARARGFATVSLGPRVLRTETAGPTIVALVQFVLGDIGSARDG